MQSFQHVAEEFVPEAKPPLWDQMEQPMRGVMHQGWALIGDDRDAGKVWRVRPEEMFLHMTSAMLDDPATWCPWPDLHPDQVVSYMWARSKLGLPGWLRKSAAPTCRPPSVFPLVKSKCFLDDGTRRCTKVAHSCWRRVIDCSGLPFARGWKAIARAARAVVRTSGLSRELFNIAQLRPELQEGLLRLNAPPVCKCSRCGAALQGITIVTADIDQAFEACPAEAVLPA